MSVKKYKVMDKATISLIIAIMALGISLLSYYGPRKDAVERIAPQADAVKFFALGKPANCDDRDRCEAWIALIEETAQMAIKALEAERSNLSGSDYNDMYKRIYGPYAEAMEMKVKLDNPGIKYPEIKLDEQHIKKLRALELK